MDYTVVWMSPQVFTQVPVNKTSNDSSVAIRAMSCVLEAVLTVVPFHHMCGVKCVRLALVSSKCLCGAEVEQVDTYRFTDVLSLM